MTQPTIETHQLDPAIAAALVLLTTGVGANGQYLASDGVNALWQYIPPYYLGNNSNPSSLSDVLVSSVTNGDVLRWNSIISKWENVAISGTGTVTSVNISSPASTVTVGGGPITTSGTLTIDLPTTGVTAGSYTNADITVDSRGRITAAANGSVSSGTVTSVAASQPAAGLTISGSPITTSGTLTFALADDLAGLEAMAGTGLVTRTAANTYAQRTITASSDFSVTNGNGVSADPNISLTNVITAGTFTNATLTVSATGRVTAASSGTAPVTSVSGTAGQITSSGGTTPTLALATTAVTPGSYTSTNLTVDAFGRITAASSGGGGSGTVTSVAVSGSNGIGVAGSPITTSGTITLSLGAITPTSVASSGSVTGTNLSGTNTGDQTITLTGDVTGSGTSSFATTLATVNGNVGSFTNASITVDAKGRITAASSGSGGGTTTNSLTFNNGGAGGASGTTFNGSSAQTISYNTIGAPSTTGSGASGTWPINITGNAVTLGGLSPDAAASASTIAARDVSGYIYATYFNQSSSNSENPSVSQVMVTNGTDNFFRKSSIASFTTAVQANASGSWGINISGTAAVASSANALNTGNNYQVNSLGVGTAASGTTGEIRATNNVTAFFSDMRLKDKIAPLTDALDKVGTLDGFYFKPNEVAHSLGYDSNKLYVGLSAQQVKAVLPEIIERAPVDERYMTLDYAKLVPLLVEAIKELKARVEELETK